MSALAPARPYQVLLVEDDSADAMLIEESLLEVAEVELTQVQDGVAALTYLRDLASPRADLIVLDLNMPRMNGTELLKILKDDDVLKVIPRSVTSCTTSDGSKRVRRPTAPIARLRRQAGQFGAFTTTVRSIDALLHTAAHIPSN